MSDIGYIRVECIKNLDRITSGRSLLLSGDLPDWDAVSRMKDWLNRYFAFLRLYHIVEKVVKNE